MRSSLPQTLLLSPHSVSSQSKQSLTPTNLSNSSNINKVRNESLVENQNRLRDKSLSSTTTSTSTTITTATEPNISPEILFLIKEQAKAIAKINALQKKVEQLEQTINYQSNSNDNSGQELSHEILTASSTSATKLVNNSNSSKERNIICDDSGGEYSRATTSASDEDELSSLLDQIARCSQHLNNSQQQNKFTNQSNNSNSNSINSNRLLSQSMQMRQKLMYSLSNPTIKTSHLARSPTIEMIHDNNTFRDSHQSNQQSISALLFEPNVETLLKNIDDLTQPFNYNKSITSNMTPTYQTKASAQHSSSPLYEAIGITGTGVNSRSFLANNNNNSSTNWHLERVKSIIKQREEHEFESQMKLADQWLENQLKTEPSQQQQQQQRLSNYIDSLEPTFR